MLPPLSHRLAACCQFVRPGDRVADVGCDHGYLGIYLLQKNIAASVIASDVALQPLASARENALRYGVEKKISFHLCSGVSGIPRDFDTLVCAGMGADTMIAILSAAPWLRDCRYRLILQCQSKRPQLRQWLWKNGFSILRETLAQDGKFIYPIMEVTYAPCPPQPLWACYLSPALLECGSPLLPEFRRRVIGGISQTIAGLEESGQEPQRLERFRKLKQELEEKTL